MYLGKFGQGGTKLDIRESSNTSQLLLSFFADTLSFFLHPLLPNFDGHLLTTQTLLNSSLTGSDL